MAFLGLQNVFERLKQKWDRLSYNEKVEAAVVCFVISIISAIASGDNFSASDPCSAMIQGKLVQVSFLNSSGIIPEFENASDVLRGSLHCLVHTSSSPFYAKKERNVEKTVPFVVHKETVNALYVSDQGEFGRCVKRLHVKDENRTYCDHPSDVETEIENLLVSCASSRGIIKKISKRKTGMKAVRDTPRSYKIKV